MLKRIKSNFSKSLLSVMILTLTLSLLPIFDYHQFLLPLPDSVAMQCRLSNISKEEVVVFIGNHNDPTVKHFVGGINLRKEFFCTYKWESMKEKQKEHIFLYQNIYTNIRVEEIEKLLQETIEKYKTVRNKWRYDRSEYRLLLNSRHLDRHGFTETPLDPYQDYYYWVTFVLTKTVTLFFAVILFILSLSLTSFCQRLFPLKEATPV